MSADMSLWSLVAGASLIVQLVLLILLLTSVASWMFIFDRYRHLKQAREAADSFEQHFWSGGDLNAVYARVSESGYETRGMERIFEAGFSEFVRLSKQSGAEPMAIVEGAQRAMRATLSREIDNMEQHLSFLATVGSTSPYIGLFGTVWGIMNSFRALGAVQQATISLVAPGIAEALVATAMGLFAAIPAVISYNRYAHYTERLANRYEAFMEEFSTLLQRQAHID